MTDFVATARPLGHTQLSNYLPFFPAAVTAIKDASSYTIRRNTDRQLSVLSDQLADINSNVLITDNSVQSCSES